MGNAVSHKRDQHFQQLVHQVALALFSNHAKYFLKSTCGDSLRDLAYSCSWINRKRMSNWTHTNGPSSWQTRSALRSLFCLCRWYQPIRSSSRPSELARMLFSFFYFWIPKLSLRRTRLFKADLFAVPSVRQGCINWFATELCYFKEVYISKLLLPPASSQEPHISHE